jgi:hypothetical protein
MAARAAVLALLAVALAGCGGDGPSAEGVVRAWAESVRLGDAEAAGALFAPGAEVVDGNRTRVLETESEAVRYVRREACAGTVVRIEDGDDATVEAEFDVRGATRCEGADREVALFRVEDGHITFLHRLPQHRDRRRVV